MARLLYILAWMEKAGATVASYITRIELERINVARARAAHVLSRVWNLQS